MSGGREPAVVGNEKGTNAATDAGENAREVDYRPNAEGKSLVSANSGSVPSTPRESETSKPGSEATGDSNQQEQTAGELGKVSSKGQTKSPTINASSAVLNGDGSTPAPQAPQPLNKSEPATASSDPQTQEVLSTGISLDRPVSQMGATLAPTMGSVVAVATSNPIPQTPGSDLPLLAFGHQGSVHQSVRRERE